MDALPEAQKYAQEQIQKEGCESYTYVPFIRRTARKIVLTLISEPHYHSGYEFKTDAQDASLLAQCGMASQLQGYIQAQEKCLFGDCDGAIATALELNDPLLADSIALASECKEKGGEEWLIQQRTKILAAAKGEGLSELSQNYYYDLSFPYWLQRCLQEEGTNARGEVACLERVIDNGSRESWISALDPHKHPFNISELREQTVDQLTLKQDCLLQTMEQYHDLNNSDYARTTTSENGSTWTEWGPEAFYYDCMNEEN